MKVPLPSFVYGGGTRLPAESASFQEHCPHTASRTSLISLSTQAACLPSWKQMGLAAGRRAPAAVRPSRRGSRDMPSATQSGCSCSTCRAVTESR